MPRKFFFFLFAGLDLVEPFVHVGFNIVPESIENRVKEKERIRVRFVFCVFFRLGEKQEEGTF